MTTAPHLTHSTMDVPAMDDSMEMASPYLGQADDFDIDIDLMEDHPSNMDSDMMGADEFATTTQAEQPNDDPILDADMADELSEGSMVDVDNYIEEDNNSIMVQDGEEPYEAEMTEGDQVEGIPPVVSVISPGPQDEVKSHNDIPAPSEATKQEEPASAEQLSETKSHSSSNEIKPDTVQNETPGQGDEGLGKTVEANTSHDDDLAETPVPAEDPKSSETQNYHEEKDITEDANETAQPVVSSTEVTQVSTETLASGKEQTSVETPEVHDTTKAQLVSESEHHVPAETESLPHEALHPVKIIYQENEIALFPPLEGDSAETFFIPDEDVAYESVALLFKALRQVLQGNVAETEILVIDVDALGIQMTEDSSHTSQVTLHQVIDVYLKLCRNDGPNEPEALYLTLSSKRAFPAEIADLLDAANDGKALSEIQSWEEYDEAEPESKEHDGYADEEHEDEQYYAAEAEQKLSLPEVQPSPETEADQVPVSEPSKIQEQELHEGPPEITQSLDNEEHHVGELGAEAPKDPQPDAVHPEAKEHDQPPESDHDQHDTTEERCESEGRNSESTTTVAAVSDETSEKEHPQDQHSTFVSGVGTENYDYEEDYGEEGHAEEHYTEQGHAEGDPEYDDFGPDGYYEDGEIGLSENSTSIQEDVAHNGIAAAPVQHSVDQTLTHQEEEEGERDTTSTTAVTSAEPLNKTDHSPLQKTTSTIDTEPQHTVLRKEQTPEPTDDLLGIAVDLMQTPANDAHLMPDHFEEINYHEDGGEHTATAASDHQDPSEHELGENEFDDFDPEYEETGTVEPDGTDPSFADPQSHDNAPTKRTRDEADDWDAVDSNLEPKRRRPS